MEKLGISWDHGIGNVAKKLLHAEGNNNNVVFWSM